MQSLIIPAIPQLEHTLHTSTSAATWLLTGYLLSAAIATPILGRVGDMVGKEKMIVAVLIALSVGTLISAVAQSLPVMLVGRVVQGAGGAIFPLAFGIIRDEFPVKKVAGAIGIMSAILGVGVGVGIVLAGPIIEHLSYHWLFWIPLALSLTATVATFIFVPESPVRSPGRINWVGALLMSGWLVTGLLAVSYGPTWGWKSASVLALFGATIVLMGLWIWSEARSSSPLVDMKMMRLPTVWSTNLAALLFGFGMFAMFVTMPQFAQTPTRVGYGFGASVTQSGLFLLPFAVAMLVVAPLTGRMAAAVGSKPLLIAGALFAAASYQLPRAGALAVVEHLCLLRAPRSRRRSRVRIDGEPHHRGGAARPDRCGHGNEHQHPEHRRRTGERGRHQPRHQQHAARRVPPGGGYILAFAVCGGALVVAAVAACMIPSGRRRDVVLSESHRALTAEAEVVVGAIAYGPES